MAGSPTLIASAGALGEVNADFVAAILAADRPRPMKAALSQLFADPGLVSSAMVDTALRSRRVDGAQAALESIAHENFGGQLTAQLAGAIEHVSQPWRLIWGEQDRVLAVPEPAEGLPLTRLAGVGHMPQMEAPAQVNRLIADLLSQGTDRYQRGRWSFMCRASAVRASSTLSAFPCA